MHFFMKKPIFVFFIELKKQLQLVQSVYWGRVRRFRFLKFGFAHGSSGSRFLRFIGFLNFYGSVPRFRFGSRTLLILYIYTMYIYIHTRIYKNQQVYDICLMQVPNVAMVAMLTARQFAGCSTPLVCCP